MSNTEFNLLEAMVEFQPDENKLQELADKVDQKPKKIFDWKKDGVLDWKYAPNAELFGYRVFQKLLAAQRKEVQTTEAARAQGNYGLRNTQVPVGVFNSSYLAKLYVPGKKN